MTEYPFVTFICAFYEENLSQSFVTWDSIRFGSNAHDNMIPIIIVTLTTTSRKFFATFCNMHSGASG